MSSGTSKSSMGPWVFMAAAILGMFIFLAVVFSSSGEPPAVKSATYGGPLYEGVAACYENQPEDFDGGDVSWRNFCDMNFAAAKAQHEKSAPRYGSMSACEVEHGLGNCGNGDANIFVPIMMGYVMAEIIDEIGDAYEAKSKRISQPIYSSSSSSGYYSQSGAPIKTSGRIYYSPAKPPVVSVAPKPAAQKPAVVAVPNKPAGTSQKSSYVSSPSAQKPAVVAVPNKSTVTGATASPVTSSSVTSTAPQAAKSATSPQKAPYVASPSTQKPEVKTTAPAAALTRKKVVATGGFGSTAAKPTAKPAPKPAAKPAVTTSTAKPATSTSPVRKAAPKKPKKKRKSYSSSTRKKRR